MPTISALRRRGYTPSSIRRFCAGIGVSKVNSLIEIVVLENCLRQELNKSASRVMSVLRPLKVTIVNYLRAKRKNSTLSITRGRERGNKKDTFLAYVIY